MDKDWLSELLGVNGYGYCYEHDDCGKKECIGTKTNLEARQAILKELEKQKQEAVREARYMGAMDFANWVITHDESSFRQERAWFKIKPQLLIQYQADLLEGLKREAKKNEG